MSHANAAVTIDELLESKPIPAAAGLQRLALIFITIGAITFLWSYFTPEQMHSGHKLLWGAYYVNLVFFMGLTVGGIVLTVIFQIVRATWAAPVRRIAEANVAFLPWIYVLFLVSYFGKEALFPWGDGTPLPGREWWMQPNFVYFRFAILLGFLFFMLRRFVRMSLRSDIGLLRERSKDKSRWSGSEYDSLTCCWKGYENEVAEIQPKMSWNAPLLIALYGVIYSLFAFEMIMSMDATWYANMFGGFIFVGNLYLAWATLAFTVILCVKYHKDYSKVVTSKQLWDLGKLTYAFCILWGYLFFAHFLPQWYGNLPEETQWMILRTREYPWKGLAWIVFPMCFVLPFVLLLSRDVKKTGRYFRIVCVIIFVGVWLEKYLLIMPQLSPGAIPLGIVEGGIFLGFVGGYILAVSDFLSRFPFIPVGHPLTRGITKW